MTSAQWFELYGPGLKAKGTKWEYDVDSETYKFSLNDNHTRIKANVLVSSIVNDPTKTAMYLLISLVDG